MHEENNRSVRYTNNFRNESTDSAKVFLYEPPSNCQRNEIKRIKKILMLVGILAIVFIIVAVIALLLSICCCHWNSNSNKPLPNEGKLFEFSGKPLAFFEK